VGWTTFPEGIKQACVWQLGERYKQLHNPITRHPLEANAHVGATSVAYGVNEADAIVGAITNPDGYTFGFQTDMQGYHANPCPGHPGNPNRYGFTNFSPTVPLAVYNAGAIVGMMGAEVRSPDVAPPRHAFISVAGPGAVSADLNDRLTQSGDGWELLRANDIDDQN
jgi:hypothetical protein